MKKYFRNLIEAMPSLRVIPSSVLTLLTNVKLRNLPSSAVIEVKRQVAAVFLQSHLTTQNQKGAMNVGWLEAIFVGIILLVVLVQFMFQQGLPMLITATTNTTAMTAAGADSATISWVGFIGKAIIIFMLVGLLVVGIRVGMTRSGGSGGGGRHHGRHH